MRAGVLLECAGDPVEMIEAAGLNDLQIEVITDFPERPREEQLQLIKGMDGIMTDLRVRVDDAFLDAAGPQLKVVSNYAVRYDNIDVEAANARNVVVCNGPPPMTEPTADVAWMLLLAASRRAREGLDLARSGTWKGYHPTLLLGNRLIGSTLLVVGAGRIGSAIARRSIGWNMEVLYVANSDKPELEADPIGATRVDLESGLARADVVVLSVALTPETRGMIDEHAFARMKSSAVLVNVSRGPVVDEEAMVRALESGEISAVGLDVYEQEPIIHSGLIDCDRAFIVPHIGSATVEDRTDLTRIAADNLTAILNGRDPLFRV